MYSGSSLHRTAPNSPMPTYIHQKTTPASSPLQNRGSNKRSINHGISNRHESKAMDGGISVNGHKANMTGGIYAHGQVSTMNGGINAHGHMSTTNGGSDSHEHMSTIHQDASTHHEDSTITHYGDGMNAYHGYCMNAHHGHKAIRNAQRHKSSRNQTSTMNGHGHRYQYEINAHGSKIMHHGMNEYGSKSMHHGIEKLGSKSVGHGTTAHKARPMTKCGTSAHGTQHNKGMTHCMSMRYTNIKTMDHGVTKTKQFGPGRSRGCSNYNRGSCCDDEDKLSTSSGSTVRYSVDTETQGWIHSLKCGGYRTPNVDLNPILISNRNHLHNRFQHPRKSHSNESSSSTASTTTPTTVGIDKDKLSLGSLFLKLASVMHLSGENLHKASECASRASRFLERASEEKEAGKPSLELVMSLYISASIHCKLGQWEEAFHVLQKALYGPNGLDHMDNMDHELAAFSGHMQLGDVLTMLGQQANALDCYHRAYDIQKGALGEMDLQVAETCGYLAEAHLQALQFDDAAHFCGRALAIHAKCRPSGSVEEANDRRLMALILSGNAEYELALEHLVLANASLTKHSKEVDVAAVEWSMGDMYVALGQYEVAMLSYQKSLNMYKSLYSDNHVKVANLYVSFAELYVKMGKHQEAKMHCESAIRIYWHPNSKHLPGHLAIGLADIARVYESMNEKEKALMFLQRALEILDGIPGYHSDVVGIEGQLGVLYYSLGRFEESFMTFKDAALKLRAMVGDQSLLLGMLLNQMGLTCIGLKQFGHAAKLFEEAKDIFEGVQGSQHVDTLAVSSNLVGVYDTLGRLDEAIHLQKGILSIKEERLGIVHPEVKNERRRLMQVLKEAGLDRRVRKTNTLEDLLLLANTGMRRKP